jgi:predicted metal-dependent HD superfamily phosphohydrolase
VNLLAALPPGVDPVAAAAVEADLLARWNEPHRHYHTAAHLASMLSIVDSNAAHADDPAQVRLAAWFHDAVYDPRAGDNEAASAELATLKLRGLGIDPAEVVRLILLTTTHTPDPGDRNGTLLADADLSILAAAPEAYDEYTAAVRREYAFVPEGDYRAGRSRVLRGFLERQTLYRVVPDKAAWTDRAHRNLRRELATLEPAG